MPDTIHGVRTEPENIIDYNISQLLDPQYLKTPQDIDSIAGSAFYELAQIYAKDSGEDPACLRFNWTGINEMLARVARDSYGLQYTNEYLNNLAEKSKLDSWTGEEIRRNIETRIGIRVNSANPRKTRVAAVFSLWMAVYRPVFYDTVLKPPQNPLFMKNFTASLNFWIATTYLDRFGEVQIPATDDEHGQIRLKHVLRDLDCRNLSLSSLEMLYCALFERDPKKEKGETRLSS